MTTFTVGYLIGSLSKRSINRKLAQALIKLAPPELTFAEIPIADLPLYNYDLDKAFPPVAAAFKQQIEKVDAVLFLTPEYNRSIPGSLKNAIDWASPTVRPERLLAQAVRRHRHLPREASLPASTRSSRDRNRRFPC